MPALGLPGQFWRLWGASTVANVGDGIREAALPLVAATLSRDPGLVAGVAVAQRLPWLIGGLPAGVVIDRVQPRRLAAAANALRMGALGVLAVALALGAAGPVLLLVVTALVGVGEVLVDGALMVAVPRMVHQRQLPRANGLIASGQIAANEFIGPPLGAVLFLCGAAVPVFADAGTLAVAAVLVLSLPAVLFAELPGSRPHDAPLRALAVGWQAVWRSPDLRRLLLAAALLAAADAAWFSLLVLFVADVLGLGAAAFGALLAAGAVGGLVGSAVAERLMNLVSPGAALAGAALTTAVGQVIIGLTSSVVVVAAMLALTSGAFAVFNIVSVTVRQTGARVAVLGRVTGTYRTVTVGAAAAGAAIGGVAAKALGLRAPMLVLAPALVIAAIVVRRIGSARRPRWWCRSVEAP